MLSDAPLYSEHRSMQIQNTELLLSSVVQKMDWTRQEEDVVMDIGCGSGNSSRDLLLPFFPKVKKLIAIDVLPEMIGFAKKNNASDKIEYHVADIEKRCTIEKWTEHISKVVSIYCFNWVNNQKAAFENIYQLLKPGGEAALLYILTMPFWNTYHLYTHNPKWSKYLKNANPHIPESHFKKYDALYYRDLLEGMGFNVVICEDEQRTHAYPSDDDCKNSVFSRSGLAGYIPDELKSDFKEDVFQGFMQCNDRGADGRPTLHYTTLTLLIQKPYV